MIANHLPKRRAALHALALVALVSTSPFAFGQTKAEDEIGDAENLKSAKDVAKRSKSISLTVFVTGDGKSIALAKVTVLEFPKGSSEKSAHTNQMGEAVFDFAATGNAKVRVLAKNWKSTLQEIVLKEGPQRVTIALVPD
jgi:hypothetical protein